MKIDKPEVGGGSSVQAKKTGRAAKTAPGGSSTSTKQTGSTKGDRVELSAMSAQFKTIKANLDQIPSVRVDRVEALKSEVEGGRYNPPAEEIADALIQAVQMA